MDDYSIITEIASQSLTQKITLSHTSSECSAQGQVLHWKCMNLGFHYKLRNQGCSFTREWIGVVASHCFLHPTLSLASEQTWKDPRGIKVEVRRVDLANWALWTSPKFTVVVKYQLHQGFWPDQRSVNPNHSSSPYNNYFSFPKKVLSM